MKWFRRAKPGDDAERALNRAHEALRQSNDELKETLRETRKIERELETNHFGPLIFQDMMRRRYR